VKNIFVKDLKEGMSLFGESFVVKSLKQMTTKQDKPYFDLELSDRTGNIKGKIWPDNIDKCQKASAGDIVKIDAAVESYNGALQLKILALSEEENYNIQDFQATSEFSLDEMKLKVIDEIDSVKNRHLNKLLNEIFNKDFFESFQKSAASYRVHHAYRSGLIEHTVEMLYFADAVTMRYPKMNRDLLITGVLLHDIGKVREYITDTTISISIEGRLLGHIFIGAEQVKNAAPKDMPKDLLDEVLHLILAHHGKLEYGSPVKPMTAEAITLSQIDELSAKTNTSYKTIHDLNDSNFTSYVRYFETELYRSPYLDELSNKDIPF
jgi:3'-5' exoribonuclease